MCLDHQLFLAIDAVEGSFDVQGFVGLGPQGAIDLSMPMSLYQEKKVVAMKVGLNYENPIHKDKVSTITFGYFDYAHVHGGEKGLNWFENKGEDNWSIMLDGLKYNGKTIQTKESKLAHIDSAGPLIQMPMSEFKLLTEEIRKLDKGV